LAASAILTYHSLDPSGSVISTHPETFRGQMEVLAAGRIPVVPLGEIQRAPGGIALTFDDGYANFLDHALPVLLQHGFPATLFVVTGKCGGHNDWARRAPRFPLMTWSDLEGLPSQHIRLGGHTVGHLNLARLPEDRAAREMLECRTELEARTGRAVEALAYPYGVSTPALRRLARRHFRLACGASLRFLSPRNDPFDLPRLDAYYLRQVFWFERLMRPEGRAWLAWRRCTRRFRVGPRT
jgi:peptidoglycan/xylan/chitin deacetylase (PgdA/CDA1 family)